MKKRMKGKENQKFAKGYSKNDQFEKKGSVSEKSSKAPAQEHKEILLIATPAKSKNEKVKKKSKAPTREQKHESAWNFKTETHYSIDALPRVASDEQAFQIFDAWLKDNHPNAVWKELLWGTKVTDGISTDRSGLKPVKRKSDGLLNAGLVIGEIWEDEKSKTTISRRLDWETNGKQLHLNIDVNVDDGKKTKQLTKYILPIEPQTSDDNNFKITYFLNQTKINLDKMPPEPAQAFLQNYTADDREPKIKKFKAMLETIKGTGPTIYEAAQKAVARNQKEKTTSEKSGTSPLVNLSAMKAKSDVLNKKNKDITQTLSSASR